MSNNFEPKVNKFIDLLKGYKLSNKDRFNPYIDNDETDKSKDSNKDRCNNLRKYLLDRPSPKYILIGESPSIGARYTGIAMTSEKILKEKFGKEYICTSKSGNIEEKTATIVWKQMECMKIKKEDFVLWNSYPFNFKSGKDKKLYKKASATEKKEEKFKEILNGFFDLYDNIKNIKIIAVGNEAKETCESIGQKYEHVTHPSYRGGKKFEEMISEIINKKK